MSRVARPTPPSMGRMVIYRHPGGAVNRQRPALAPAIVRDVQLRLPPGITSVDLWVFGDGGMYQVNGILEGAGPYQWSWPPKV